MGLFSGSDDSPSQGPEPEQERQYEYRVVNRLDGDMLSVRAATKGGLANQDTDLIDKYAAAGWRLRETIEHNGITMQFVFERPVE